MHAAIFASTRSLPQPPALYYPPDNPKKIETESVLERFEALVEAVLPKPAPAALTGDRDWLRLFQFCESYRDFLSQRVRYSKRIASPRMADVWLRQLASPPCGEWDGVRNGLQLFIASCGLPPRNRNEALLSANTRVFTSIDPQVSMPDTPIHSIS